MDDRENRILEHLERPEILEHLFRTLPTRFEEWFREAQVRYPDSETIRVWSARLNYHAGASVVGSGSNLKVIVALSLLTGFLVKLPGFFPINGDWFYPRFTPIIVIGALAGYFCLRVQSVYFRLLIASLFLGCAAIALIYPFDRHSASLIMYQIHMPLAMLSLLAVAFMAHEWTGVDARLRYIRYLGEVAIYSALILLGGIALTLITLGLFSLIGLSVERWYFEYVVVFGLVASPIVATYLYDSILGRDSRLATVISNIFSPLFLVTVAVYLLAVLFQGENPYTDRNFLILFNGLLVAVWAITVFSISGKGPVDHSRLSDLINVALVGITLLINAIALSAIIFRVSEYGITPNRVAVTGANVLIFTHLILILREYLRYLKVHGSLSRLNRTVVGYLPVYSGWSFFVAVALPLLFGFE